MKPSVGRIVHFVQKKGNPHYGDALVHLPAVIVAVWTDTCVNLQVMTDGTNSEDGSDPRSIKWVTSANRDDTGLLDRSWHWPERVE